MAEKVVKWPKVDPATVAPTRDGKPDMRNFMPTRFVSKEESEARGWTYFYIGDSCRWGHKAPRYVSNDRLCVDCERTKDHKPTIGAKGEQEYTGKRPYKQKDTASTAVAPFVPKPLEPDALEKRFLEAYVRLKDFGLAADSCGRQESEFLGRLSFNKLFREAVHTLEADNGLSRTSSLDEAYDWTDDKRNVLMRMYINTGDLAQAMKTIGVNNYHYELELETNQEFRRDMERAEELAWRQVDRYAISGALSGGNTKLLERVMSANIDKYNERIKIDMNVTQKLTEDQLNTRLAQGLEQLARLGHTIALPRPAVDAEFTVDDPVREVEVDGDGGSDDSPYADQLNNDLV